MQRVKKEWWAKRKARIENNLQRLSFRKAAAPEAVLAPITLCDEFSKYPRNVVQRTLEKIDREMWGSADQHQNCISGFDVWASFTEPVTYAWPFDFTHDPPDFKIRRPS